VRIEAKAYATPVIAYRRGSIPEVIEDGVTGFIIDELEAAKGSGAYSYPEPKPPSPPV
jgi:glycosyltransferase involved in cell wall biosynthesis